MIMHKSDLLIGLLVHRLKNGFRPWSQSDRRMEQQWPDCAKTHEDVVTNFQMVTWKQGPVEKFDYSKVLKQWYSDQYSQGNGKGHVASFSSFLLQAWNLEYLEELPAVFHDVFALRKQTEERTIGGILWSRCKLAVRESITCRLRWWETIAPAISLLALRGSKETGWWRMSCFTQQKGIFGIWDFRIFCRNGFSGRKSRDSSWFLICVSKEILSSKHDPQKVLDQMWTVCFSTKWLWFCPHLQRFFPTKNSDPGLFGRFPTAIETRCQMWPSARWSATSDNCSWCCRVARTENSTVTVLVLDGHGIGQLHCLLGKKNVGPKVQLENGPMYFLVCKKRCEHPLEGVGFMCFCIVTLCSKCKIWKEMGEQWCFSAKNPLEKLT